MANYFARKAGNIDAADVWATTPTGTAADVWATFTTNDVLHSNGFSITVNVDTTVGEVRNNNANGATAGGSFVLSNNITLTANAFGGSTASPCVNFLGISGTSSTLVGSTQGGTTPSGHGANNNSLGTLNIIGNVNGGPGDRAYGAHNNSSGTLNITGSAIGGNLQNTQGAFNSSSGILNIIGSVTGGTGTNAHGVNNNSTGTLNITGSVIGGTISTAPGANNASVGTVFIQGSAIGGSGAAGANNASTGVVIITKAIGNDFGLGSVGIPSGQVGLANSQNGRAYVEQVEFGSRGATPISGPVYILPSNRNTLTGYTTALGNTVTFYNSLSVNGLLPPVSSVQAGVIYNVGNSVGTMAVPSASAVQFGVPVDNTVGTAALQPQDVWGYARLSATQVDSMGDRLRNTATTQSIGYQIASFNL